jgi:hypothetical protein
VKHLEHVILKWMAIARPFRVNCDHFSADSVRVYVFQQLLFITYALTPYGSKVGIATENIQSSFFGLV